MTAPAEETTPGRVAWGRVAVFYAVALGVACAITAVIVLAGGDLLANKGLQLAVAFLYMPAPLIAGLVVEVMAGKGFLIRSVFKGMRQRLPRLLVLAVGFWLLYFVLQYGLTLLLGNALHVPGVGALPTDDAAFRQAVTALIPSGLELSPEVMADVPKWWFIWVYVFFASLFAGATINAVFAFGEEYGWRGVLQDELAPLGEFKANVLIGLLWGLWHAPLIVFAGFNFPGQPLLGTLMMTASLVPFAFIEYQARRLTGSLFGPAVVHGIFNGMAGLLLFAAGRDGLIGFPFGVLGFLTLAAVALLMSVLPVKPLPLPGSDAYPQDRVAAEAVGASGVAGPPPDAVATP
jgi:membrane protease YdiL (CAAX protease family)